MVLPTEPVTLTAEQIKDLNSQLSNMRHDINNDLSLIVAALELLRHKPQTAERMITTLMEQPPKIAGAMNKFSQEFEKNFGIIRR
jgi:hypothetical protein